MNRNYILCYIHGYQYEDIAHFFTTRKINLPNARPVVFYENISQETVIKIKQSGALMVQSMPIRRLGMRNSWERFWPVARLVGHNIPLRSLRAKFAELFVETMVRRFLAYRVWLLKNKNAKNVLLADVRDLIFQGNPFSIIKKGEQIFFFEQTNYIKNCFINTGWINKMFGAKSWESFGNQKVICAGTILGTRLALISFLNAFVDILYKCKKFDLKFFGGFDQGIVNYLVRNNKVLNSVVCSNGEEIWTGKTDGINAFLGEDGYIINKNGRKISVIHQFDRDITFVKNGFQNQCLFNKKD